MLPFASMEGSPMRSLVEIHPMQEQDNEVGGSNEIEIFGRIVAFLVSNASEFQGVSFDTPYDILI